MWTKSFWKKTCERALKTFVQAVIAAFGVGQVGDVVGVNLVGADWVTALSLAGSAAALSVVTSLLSSNLGDPESPSAVKE